MIKPFTPTEQDAMVKPDLLRSTLRSGFSRYYMDPHNFALETARCIERNMTKYASNPGEYVAPYTSLVTSSMMGKSRLMKEVASHLPSVYICLRNTRSSGYPVTTPELPTWFEKGINENFGLVLGELYDPLHLLPSLKFSVFLLSLIDQLATLVIHPDTLPELGLTPTKFALPSQVRPKANFSWLWKFFAEHPRNSTKLAEFWKEVIADATSRMIDKYEPETAEEYLTGSFGTELQLAYCRLANAFVEPGVPKERFTLLLCIDEARSLCERSAVDGRPIRDASRFCTEVDEPPEEGTWESFSNFRALRRALKFLEQAAGQPMVSGFGVTFPIPRVFGLFTDTTSRLANFQPRALEDISLRLVRLPTPGLSQFEPLHTFSSVDAHAIVANEETCTSNIKNVANAERLIKFGRAGWYSVYTGKTDSDKRHYNYRTIVDLAICKLLCVDHPNRVLLEFSNNTKILTPKNLLRLLALLAPRLALAAGPFTAEAEEMISSHLAILVRTDDDRHFVRTAYPSEPVVAQASASIIAKLGWALPLKALCHYVHNGIVGTAGYRGELLSKILCLMAIDSAQIEPPDLQWSYAQPIKVSRFLDHLLAAPSGATSFSTSLEAGALHVDEKELQRFLNGYVFFNHFIRVEVQLSADLLVKLWNRGAAIQPVGNCEAFDHVIPVMLAQVDETPALGPLYGKWTDREKREASNHVSVILLNSRNHKNPSGKEHAAAAIQLTPSNYADYTTFVGGGDSIFSSHDGGPTSVYLSILQSFGPRLVREKECVKVITYPRSSPRVVHPPRRQIVVILEELGGETYRCLQDGVINKSLVREGADTKDEDAESTDIVESNEEVIHGKRREVRLYLKRLKQEKSLFLESLEDNDPKRTGITENLPGVLRTEDQEEKWRPKWKIVKDNLTEALNAGAFQL